MRIALLALALTLSACSTPYQEMGFMGGVAAQRMTADTYRIVSRGNGYTGQTQVQDYTMLKAAETTKAAGGTHFRVVSAQDATREGAFVNPGHANTTFYANTASTTYTPATVTPVIKPGEDTYIRVLTLAPGQAAPPDAISADEIIQFVGARVKRG